MTSVLSRKLASRRKRDDQSTIGQLRSDYTLRIIRWLLPQCCLLLQATLWHSKQLSIIFSPYSNCHTIRCILTYFRHRETLGTSVLFWLLLKVAKRCPCEYQIPKIPMSASSLTPCTVFGRLRASKVMLLGQVLDLYLYNLGSSLMRLLW